MEVLLKQLNLFKENNKDAKRKKQNKGYLAFPL